MRLAIILALALAACTGKNAAKGTVEYVPVVPLSVLQGAGGEPAEPDAAVGGEEAAGGALAPDAEADAGAGGTVGDGDAGEADAAAPACAETAWTDDRPRELDEADIDWNDCQTPCRVISACAAFYLDDEEDVAECPCVTPDDRPRIFDECMVRCTTAGGLDYARFHAFGEDDNACGPATVGSIMRFAETRPGAGLAAACRGTAE